MKYLVLLLFLTTAIFGQDFSTIKMVVSCEQSENIVTIANDGSEPSIFKTGDKYTINDVTNVSSRYEATVTLSFPTNGLMIHLSDETDITINSAEQDVSIDENGVERRVGPDIGMVVNIKVAQGRADFSLSTVPNEVSSFIVWTDHGEVEVHSKKFAVVSSIFGFTKIRCFDGYLAATMANGKVERIENEEVSLYDGNVVLMRAKTPTIFVSK